MASEKIDGYLVYRRRNKRTASGVISLNSEGCKGIVENKPEHAEDSNGRDHGGTLIFCKTCCHSYHLQCLSPQLESIPTGEWQCPNCSDNDDLSKPTDNFQTHKKENNSSSSCSICSKAKNLKLSEHEAVKSKSTSADGPNASASLGKSEVRNKWEATLSIINTDNLLLLSEACSSMESMNMPTNSDKDRTTMQQTEVVYAEEDETKKRKRGKLPARQKEKEPLKNKNKKPLASSGPSAVKQNSDLERVKHTELVASNSSLSSKGGKAQSSSCKGLKAKDKDDLASGNIRRKTSKKNPAFLRGKGNKDDWSDTELDALWIAARRHGTNWDEVWNHPIKVVFRNKTSEDLARKWDKETLKLFPSAIALPINNSEFSTITNRPTTPAMNRSGLYSSSTGTTAVQFPSVTYPTQMPTTYGIPPFPAVEKNQNLNKRMNIPLWNSGIYGPYHQGSSSSASHSFQNFPSAPPQRTPNVNLSLKAPMVQTLHERPNLVQNFRPMRMQTLQTPKDSVYAKGISPSTKVETGTQFLLGGLVPLPKNEASSKSAGHDIGNTESNPTQVKGSGGSYKNFI